MFQLYAVYMMYLILKENRRRKQSYLVKFFCGDLDLERIDFASRIWEDVYTGSKKSNNKMCLNGIIPNHHVCWKIITLSRTVIAGCDFESPGERLRDPDALVSLPEILLQLC